jgi:hypothetical protein
VDSPPGRALALGGGCAHFGFEPRQIRSGIGHAARDAVRQIIDGRGECPVSKLKYASRSTSARAQASHQSTGAGIHGVPSFM